MLDGSAFEADVLRSEQPVLVDFYAEGCSPCRMMAHTIDRLGEELAGELKVGKIDVDVNEDIAIRYGVASVPTLGLFRDGKLVDRLVGFPGGPAPIRAWLARNVPAAAVPAGTEI